MLSFCLQIISSMKCLSKFYHSANTRIINTVTRHIFYFFIPMTSSESHNLPASSGKVIRPDQEDDLVKFF